MDRPQDPRPLTPAWFRWLFSLLSRPGHIRSLWQPAVSPASFFREYSTLISEVPPGFLLYLWSALAGAAVAPLSSPLYQQAASGNDGAAGIAAAFGVAIAIGALTGLVVLFVTSVPALWFHICVRLFAGRHPQDMVVSWRVVAYASLPLLVPSAILLYLALIPGLAGLFELIIRLALWLVAVRAVFWAARTVYDMAVVRAALVSAVSTAPIPIIVIAVY